MWMWLPLVGRVVGEIVGLRRLEVWVVGGRGSGGGMGDKGREGKRGEMRGEMMRKIEEKCVRELVGDLKALEVLRLEGWEDEGFARGLEGWVRGGRR